MKSPRERAEQFISDVESGSLVVGKGDELFADLLREELLAVLATMPRDEAIALLSETFES